jgi:hypothetical protein
VYVANLSNQRVYLNIVSMIRILKFDRPVPELLVLHICHVIIICIFEGFRDASAVSFFVLPCAYKAVNDCKDDADCGGYDLH